VIPIFESKKLVLQIGDVPRVLRADHLTL